MLLRSADSLIDVFLHGRPISTLAKLANFRELYFWVLSVIRAHPGVNSCSLHGFSLSVLGGLPPSRAHLASSVLECFFARAKPPRRAQVRLSSFVVFLARASPPSFPRPTACGFFGSMAISYLALSKNVKRIVSSIGTSLILDDGSGTGGDSFENDEERVGIRERPRRLNQEEVDTTHRSSQ